MQVEIELDDVVLAALDESRNTGRRIRLRVSVDTTTARPAPAAPVGPLAPLMFQDELFPGEKLYWERPRRGERHSATVGADGSLTVRGRRFHSPSGAARAVAGVHVDGWNAWRRERDGALLAVLRERASRRPG